MMQAEFEKNGYITFPFPHDLRNEMLDYIFSCVKDLGENSQTNSLEEIAASVPDGVWQQRMSRSFRIFPPSLAQKAHTWAHQSFCKSFNQTESAVNVVLPQEVLENPQISEEHLAIYWRCVRPGKPDAGRPHRDASFWDLEFQEGYNPKIPFPFNYLKNCKKIWIPLYGCTLDTSLRVIPQSHLMDIPTIVEQTEYGRRPSICPKWLQDRQFISPVELSQGSCILFDMNLVHVGPRHNHSALRISAEFNFISQ